MRMKYFMNSLENTIEKYLHELGGKYSGIRIFVGNNSLAAYKFIVSMRDFSYRRFGRNLFEFYGMERPSDRKSRSKYLDMLSGYIEIETETPEESFKSPERICESALFFQCTYVWPGWGHASEDPALPRECMRNGLIFIGPSEKAMNQLGSKISANKLADRIGIESIPWIEVSDDKEEVKEFCRKIGYPVMVKSPEGGGGKGIRVVEGEESLEKALETVQNESRSNERLFVTKYLRRVKHIELQIVADHEGHTEVVSSRDCTMQRRNQKLIEEGPAILKEDTETEINEKAKKMVQAASYTNACTVEFVYDLEGERMYFLECNPRLQVEHTVSELLTGSNLCATQWLISCGVTVDQLKRAGVMKVMANTKEHRHVVGARIISESGECGFTPSTGSVFVSSDFQVGTVGYFSVDSGTITPYNDSQFGHVFGLGETRDEAISALQMALGSLVVTGEIKTLNNFLVDLVGTEEFRQNVHTTKSAERFQKVWSKREEIDPFSILCFCAISGEKSCKEDSEIKKMHLNFQVNGLDVRSVIRRIDANVYSVEINGGVSVIEVVRVLDDKYRIRTDKNEIKTVYFSKSKIFTEISIDNSTVRFNENSAGNIVYSTVPGRVVRTLKKEGLVKKGEEYLEVESMKNLILLKAPKEGQISYKVEVEEIIETGDPIAEIVCDSVDASVEFTEKIVYRNTLRDFTRNIFSQFDVPEGLLSYKIDSIREMLKIYTENSDNKTDENKQIETYIKKSIKVLFDLENVCILDEFKDILKDLKYQISNRDKYKQEVEMIYTINRRIERYDREKELEKARHMYKEGRIDEIVEETSSIADDVVFLLCMEIEKEDRKKIITKWAIKIFRVSGESVEITEKEGQIQLVVDVSDEKKIFYIRKRLKDSQLCRTEKDKVETNAIIEQTEACKCFTLVEIDCLDVAYKRYGREHEKLYDEIDVRRIEGSCCLIPKSIAERDSIEMLYSLWNRRITVFLGSKVAVVFSGLFSHEFLCKKTVGEFVSEALFSYALSKSSLPMEVHISVLDEIEKNTEIMAYLQRDIAEACFSLEELNAKCFVRGIFRKGGSTEGFCHTVRMDRGFKESFLFINEEQIFYKIDSLEIKNTRSVNQASQIFKSGMVEEPLDNARKKAKLLNTIYLYDAALLLGIFVREIDPACTISEIEGRGDSAISGWRFKSMHLDFVFIGNDITVKNGAFSIEEDEYFSKCAKIALLHRIPFVYLSSNSGAKIEVLDIIKPFIRFSSDLNMIYMEEKEYAEFQHKELIEVAEMHIGRKQVYQITEIIGKYGMGVENLSFSAQIAKDMAKMYNEIPTITYVSGRAVGIGAYLASIGGRIIQKANSPIILTGYQALNSLVQKELYKNNLEIGGPFILSKNGVVHKTVSTDTEGMHEILKWLDYIQGKPHLGYQECLTDNQQIEQFSSEEIIQHISDKDAFTEYLEEWAPNVRIGRTKIAGKSCGVIFPRTGTLHSHVPAPLSVNQGKNPREIVQVIWTENLLLPESSKKIAQGIRDFSLESLPILILLNWKGFSAGHLDMFDGILQNGSEIIRSMEQSQSRIFAYLPPFSELRGGSWVVFDKKIGNRIKFTAHATAKGSVIHPDGLSKIKCKQEELAFTLDLSDLPYSKVLASKLAKAFCSLHDSSKRMSKMGVIDGILKVSELKESILEYFTE